MTVPAQRERNLFLRWSRCSGIPERQAADVELPCAFPLWSHVRLGRDIPGWGSLDGLCGVVVRKSRRHNVDPRPGVELQWESGKKITWCKEIWGLEFRPA